jgi:hypothetical protein
VQDARLAGTGVGSTHLGALVDRELVAADLDGVAEAGVAACGGLHRRLIFGGVDKIVYSSL